MEEPADGRDVLLLALFTGMRRSEIISLKWQHLDLTGGTLAIPRIKNGDPLELPLSGFLIGLLHKRQALVGQSSWVFPSHAAPQIHRKAAEAIRHAETCALGRGVGFRFA
jgi:integrase